MEQLPVQILPDGKSGAPDDAFGLEDSGESSEGHGTDEAKSQHVHVKPAKLAFGKKH